MNYTIVLSREDDGRYTVTVPALKGCVTFGETLPEALQMAQEVIELFTESLRARGLEVPEDNPDVRVSTRETPEILVYRLQVREADPVA